DVQSLLRQTIRAELAHADAMAPASASEHKSGHAVVCAVLPVNHKELFMQTECRTNPAAANMPGALGAHDFQINHAPGRAACGDAQVGDSADAANGSAQTRLHFAQRKFCRPFG